MNVISANGIMLHIREDGDANGIPVVFSNSLGTDLRLWDRLIPLLPAGFRYIRYDTRGHGLSECPEGQYTIDDLASDAVSLIENLALDRAIFIGLSIGGMTGQKLAATRPDLLRGLVLSNTASKMGDPVMWQERISAIEEGGICALADAILQRWFGPKFRAAPDLMLWSNMLTRTPKSGYLSCCAALAAADLRDQTARIKLPCLAIAGSLDGSCPPNTVADTAQLISGSKFHTIDGVGHLPCVEDPNVYAAVLIPFLEELSND